MLFVGEFFVAHRANEAGRAYDSAAVAQIKDEGMNHSQVMDILSYISDILTVRDCTWSPAAKVAEIDLKTKISFFFFFFSHLEGWGPTEKDDVSIIFLSNLVATSVPFSPIRKHGRRRPTEP